MKSELIGDAKWLKDIAEKNMWSTSKLEMCLLFQGCFCCPSLTVSHMGAPQRPYARNTGLSGKKWKSPWYTYIYIYSYIYTYKRTVNIYIYIYIYISVMSIALSSWGIFRQVRFELPESHASSLVVLVCYQPTSGKIWRVVGGPKNPGRSREQHRNPMSPHRAGLLDTLVIPIDYWKPQIEVNDLWTHCQNHIVD